MIIKFLEGHVFASCEHRIKDIISQTLSLSFLHEETDIVNSARDHRVKDREDLGHLRH